MNPLIAIFVLILIVTIVIGGLMGLCRLITRSLKIAPASIEKKRVYECGAVGDPSPSVRVSSKFYLTAILFVLFDIEIIFLYPWAVAYRDFLGSKDGSAYLLAFILFLALFIIGLFWEIRVQALRWK